MTSTMRFDKWENTLGQPYGTVLQVIQVVDTEVTNFSGGVGNTFFAYNNLNNTITPKGSNSKFLVRFQVNVSSGNAGGSMRIALNLNGTTYGTTTLGTQRSSSNSYYHSGSLPGNANIVGLTGEYLFQNSGLSNVSVSFELFKQGSTDVLSVNRSSVYDDTSRGRPASWVTIMEIAQ
jgi:hypothetical protein